MKKSTKNLIIGLVLLVVAALLVGGIYITFGPQATHGSKGFVVNVTDSKGDVVTYDGKTDAEYLSELMEELKKQGFTYESTTSEYGMFITSINGETADYDTNGAYWSIYVNGDYGQYGADQQPVNDGDVFGFRYEKAE
ncbi:protein of unknown function [Lachnospiraceae bacterium XBD2001]|nr:protein of unknown function [Lachnospiraceae bacterium XBD2001]